MFRKFITALLLLPVAVLIVMFAVANRELVTISFDPFNPASPAYAFKIPLFVLIIALTIFGVLLGGIAAWLRQGKWRRAARRLEGENRTLRRDIEGLTAKLDSQAALPVEARIHYRPPAA